MQMINAFIFLLLMGLPMFYLAYKKGDGSHIKSIIIGKNMFFTVLPLLLLAFSIAGLLQVVLPADLIADWLGEEAGYKGLLIGPVIGGLIQGGPYAFFPFFASVFKESVGPGTAVAMITGWGMLNIGHLPFELTFLGPRFVVVKFLACVGVPPLAGLIAHLFFA